MWRVAALVAGVTAVLLGAQISAHATTDVAPRCIALQERMGPNWREASDDGLRRWWHEADHIGCPDIATQVSLELDRGEPAPVVIHPIPTPPTPVRPDRVAMPPPPQRLEPPVCPPTAIGWIDLAERHGVYFAPGYTDGTQAPAPPAKNQRIMIGPNGVPFYHAANACPNPSRCDWNPAGVSGSVEIVELERFEVGVNNLRRWQLCVRQ